MTLTVTILSYGGSSNPRLNRETSESKCNRSRRMMRL